MNYLSVCSGIEAATVAWHPLGWKPIAFSEIESFPNKVLAYHYPDVPNLGDMTKFKEWKIGTNVDVLVGGTPCQSFSIAGLRKGLDDPRGNLMLTYLAIADKYRPTWVVWENVPGVLSSNGGRDFGTFLGGLGQLGYGFAYRVLDAQYVRTDGYPHAVPQRRRRVFVVGHLGSWQRAAAVLFDSESLRGNPPPRREAGKSVTHATASCLTSSGRGVSRTGDTRGQDPVVAVCRSVSPTITQNYGKQVDSSDTALGPNVICMSHGQANAEISVGFAPTLNCNHEQPIAFTARGEGADAQHEVAPTMRSLCCGADGHQSGAAGLAVAYRTNAAGQVTAQDGISAALNTQTDPCAQIVAFDTTQITSKQNGSNPQFGDPCHPLARGAHAPAIASNMQVRRLTPRECERLQAFKDDYTNIPGASDTARYKALGNSMAVNVMQLIGQRIQMVSEI